MYVSYVCEYVFANFVGPVPVAKVTQINQQKFNFKILLIRKIKLYSKLHKIVNYTNINNNKQETK